MKKLYFIRIESIYQPHTTLPHRFVLSCNDSTKIIDAIQSRCAILRFTKLTDKQVLARLLEIIEKEKVIKRKNITPTTITVTHTLF